jgi:hypothetical protein
MKQTSLHAFRSQDDLTDLCAATRRWLEEGNGNDEALDLGGGEWNLWPEVAQETQVYPSNNDAGRVKVALYLKGLKNLIIDGNGARLLVRGSPLAGRGRMTVSDAPLLPIVIEDCQGVTVKNLSLDRKTPATVQGLCTKTEADAFEVELQTEQHAFEWNHQLFVEGEGWTWPVRRLLCADPETGSILPNTGDNFGVGYDVNWRYEQIGPKKFRITGPAGRRPSAGSLVLCWCSNHDTGARRSPGIFICNSENITLEGVTLHYTWGMGVIAQNTTNIILRNLMVEPSGQRKFSLASDGAHFVSCRGSLLVENCRFQNQFDDALNTHGLYYQVVRRLSVRSIRVRTMHPQHQGVVALRRGDRLSFQARPYLLPRGEAILSDLVSQNSETIDLTFDHEPPESLAPGDVIENLSAYPDITLRGCTIRWNRARGVLLNGGGRILVENNYFETAGSAILVESSPVWGESGPLRNLTIKDNLFNNCTHCAMWGKAVIWAVPEFRENVPAQIPAFHGQLTLVSNRFSKCHAPELLANSFEQVVRR